jgi:hypothetical protein
MSKAPVAAPTSALALPQLTDADFTRALAEAGLIQSGPVSGVRRMQIDGSSFVAGDDIFVYNQATKQPAFTARLVGPLVQYQGFYFTEQEARIAGRPNMIDKFCKSFFDVPTQARKFAEDGTSCPECPFGPFLKETLTGKKCQWRADLELQIMPPSGQLTGDEQIWLLNLSTTSVIEFVGTARNQPAGSVSDLNFLQKLARMGAETTPDNPQQGAIRAMRAYQLGGVVAAFRLLSAQNTDGSIKWRVVSLDPVTFVDMPEPEEAPALAAAAIPVSNPEPDDLPF